MINNLAKEIHAINVKNGFYEEEKNIGEMIALIHSEASEALEADRKGAYANMEAQDHLWEIFDEDDFDEEFSFSDWFRFNIKDTFEDELADIMIRVMDLAAHKGIDLEKHIRGKMRYNSLREYKHGKNINNYE